MHLLDLRSRPLANLRLSVTDRCNLRCSYCMPEESYQWLPKQDILTFEEIDRLVDAFTSLGVDRVRLTGGEPLLRQNLPVLIGLLAKKTALGDVALTTNGVLLADLAQPLAQAGLRRITVSLDTLRPGTFHALTKRDDHARVLAGIQAAARWLPRDLKLDSVIIKGVNDDELCDLLDFANEYGAEVRFIEYMDVGGATAWSAERVVSLQTILDTLAARFGTPQVVATPGNATAQRFRLPDGRTFGVIASTTQPFCDACDRSRLTADGMWYMCLYARGGLDLRGPLRAGLSTLELAQHIAATWRRRDKRGAMERLGIADRGPMLDRPALAQDPHLEMHTRGG